MASVTRSLRLYVEFTRWTKLEALSSSGEPVPDDTVIDTETTIRHQIIIRK